MLEIPECLRLEPSSERRVRVRAAALECPPCAGCSELLFPVGANVLVGFVCPACYLEGMLNQVPLPLWLCMVCASVCSCGEPRSFVITPCLWVLAAEWLCAVMCFVFVAQWIHSRQTCPFFGGGNIRVANIERTFAGVLQRGLNPADPLRWAPTRSELGCPKRYGLAQPVKVSCGEGEVFIYSKGVGKVISKSVWLVCLSRGRKQKLL